MDIGTRIAAWRRSKGLSVQELAVAADVTAAAVYQWENGLKKKGRPREKIKPSLDKLEKVVAALGLTMEQFYGRTPKTREAKAS